MTLLKVKNLSKNLLLRKQKISILKNISFEINEGEILGLGGESGCGKSTLGKLLMGLIPPSEGSISLNNVDISNHTTKVWCKNVQMIFQHPSSSLNPRFTVENILSEPFEIHRLVKGAEKKKKIINLLNKVGLSDAFLQRYPHELSGGQKQRIAIARSLALSPRLLICDEPFSSLDVSIQIQMINLLKELQNQERLSYLIISHDLSILRYLSHRLAIMYMGEFVEYGTTSHVYNYPAHPYTQALISAMLFPDPIKEKEKNRMVLKDEPPSILQKNSGCNFYGRCPFGKNICQEKKPEWQEIQPGHFAACHFLKNF